MKEKLKEIRENAIRAIRAEGANLEEIRIKYLGKKGELTAVLRGMGALSGEERPVIGALANEVREKIECAIKEAESRQQEQRLQKKLESEKIDVTMPAEKIARRPPSACESAGGNRGYFYRHGL